ncbi:membrane protein [Salmonella enterica subsp. arizonae]|nr:membrane protein [Salmonella enterica subsp. arizonae]
MENNTIKCPFCLKESQRGVHVCTGCQASVLYGTYPGWYAAVIILLAFGLSALIGMSTGMAGATISLPLIFVVGFVAGKAIFSDNIIFRRRM